MKRYSILYAILFSIYPVLFLYSYNNGYLLITELYRPLAITLLSATIMLGLLRLLTRNSDLAAALTAFWGLWFLSYGHLLRADEIFSGRLIESMVRQALWVWLAIFVLGALVIIRLRKRLPGARPALFVIAVVLVGMTSLSIARFESHRVRLRALQPKKSASVASQQNQQDTSNYPDIYYIILDGYARPDVFEELYGESNEEFVKFLEKKGGYIQL